MPACAFGPAACALADGAAAGPTLLRLQHLPNEIWQQIARAALAAEGGDLRVWARLSEVSSLWRAAVSCAVVQANALPEAVVRPGEHLRLRSATASKGVTNHYGA